MQAIKCKPACTSMLSDQHLCYLLSSITSKLARCIIPTLYLVSVAEQDGVCLAWLQNVEDWSFFTRPIYKTGFIINKYQFINQSNDLTLHHLVSSADNFCQQFGPRSGPTKCLDPNFWTLWGGGGGGGAKN